MELVCLPWIVPVTLLILCVLLAYGWARTVYRWHVAVQYLRRQFEEE
jgi:hypothetical protein